MRGRTTLLVLIVAIAALFLFGRGCYNGLVDEDQNVKTAWANVQSSYQRRADLIPNIVETVKGEADFERGTLEAVQNARSRATSVQVNPDELTPEQIEKFQSAQGELSRALGRLLVVTENYPNLRANDAFRDLQRQLEGTENRINTERNRFNEVVNLYNKKVRSFPTNMVAGMFGFSPRPPFAADPGAENAPKVNFNRNNPAVNSDTSKTR